MKTSVISVLALAAAASATKYSTYYETETITITSCEPYVTKCAYHETSKIHTKTKECDDDDKTYPTPTPVASYPVKHETTKGYGDVSTTAKAYTTTPAVYEPPKKDEYTISTIYETKKYTITSCPVYVTDCPVGHVTTTVVASTTLCSVTDKHYPTKPAEPEYPSKSPVAPCPGGAYCPSKPVEPEYPTKSPVAPCPGGAYCPSKPVEPAYPSKSPVAPCPGGAYCPATTIKTAYGTAAPVTPTKYPGGKNTTIEYTGAATAQRAGGLLLAVGVAAAALL